jgi:phage antirepressor YoqD-like protein
MSSREIADLVESRHDNVKTTVERLVERGVIVRPSMQVVQIPDSMGRSRSTTEYHICKRDSYVVVAQLSPEFTARLVDRWQELEEQVAPAAFQVPQTMSEALRLAANQAEQIESQQKLIEQQAPAVEFVGRYVDAGGSKGFREVCKLLGANEREFRAFLTDTDVLYTLAGRLVPYHQHIAAGRFEIKAGVTHDENAYAFNQTRFTPKGIEWIAGKWMARRLNEKEVTA